MELFNNALHFAAEKHKGQKRKTSDIPYILHPMEVASIASTMTEDETVLAAALLHDTVEDTDTTLEELRENFGKNVYLLVMTETEEKRDNLPPEATWHLRKEESLNILENTKDIRVKMLWLSDKLANMRSFYRLYRAEGIEMWKHFNQKNPKEQAWYYRSIENALAELSEFDAYDEYVRLTEYIFKEI